MITQFKDLKKHNHRLKRKTHFNRRPNRNKSFDNDINKAMRQMKRKLQQQGMFRELKKLRFHEKPSAKRKRERRVYKTGAQAVEKT